MEDQEQLQEYGHDEEGMYYDKCITLDNITDDTLQALSKKSENVAIISGPSSASGKSKAGNEFRQWSR